MRTRLRLRARLSRAWSAALAVLALVSLASACIHSPSPRSPHRLGALPPSWLTASWCIDPLNVSTCADDRNLGTSCSCGGGNGPPLTWSGLVKGRWGCTGGRTCPELQQVTTITALSNHTDNTDPVFLSPSFERGAYLVVTCPLPTPTYSFSVSAIQARAPATAVLERYSGSPTGQSAIGQFWVDTTNPARGWVAVTGSTIGRVTSMVSAVPIPTSSFAPSYQGAASQVSDTINSYNSMVQVNFVSLTPTIADYAGGPNNFLFVQNCTLFDPAGTGVDNVRIGPGVVVVESIVQRNWQTVEALGDSADSGCINCNIRGGVVGGRLNTGKFLRFSAGLVQSGTFAPVGIGVALDGDITFLSSNTLPGGVSVNQVYEGTGVVLTIGGPVSYFAPIAGGYGSPSRIWGQGSSNVTGRLGFDATQGGWTGIYLSSGGVNINGSGTACSSCGAGTQTITCGIGITGTSVDSSCSASAFGGTAFGTGVGSIVSSANGGLN